MYTFVNFISVDLPSNLFLDIRNYIEWSYFLQSKYPDLYQIGYLNFFSLPVHSFFLAPLTG